MIVTSVVSLHKVLYGLPKKDKRENHDIQYVLYTS